MNAVIDPSWLKKWWMVAQKLDQRKASAKGVNGVKKAIEHLGSVQIDTIHVIERSHHHILFTRLPDYQKKYLHLSQSRDKTVFEYWTHALSYIPTKDFRFFLPEMMRFQKNPSRWYQSVKKEDLAKVLKLVKEQGPLSIRDINDDILIEKNHPWASRKPSKKALQMAFFSGKFVISERIGMLKKYELMERHFDWKTKPRPASGKEVIEYLVDRGLRTQGAVTVDSVCYMNAKNKAAVRECLEKKVQRGDLVSVMEKGNNKDRYFSTPEVYESRPEIESGLVHLLSPFDPLVIQRKRFHRLFGYEHRFEAYVPKEKRKYGYFGLPVLIEDKVVAVIDLKTDRQKKKLLVQQWTWLGTGKSGENKRRIEQELCRFERFQLEESHE